MGSRALLGRDLPHVHKDLSVTYERQLHKWLLIAPLIGLIVGLAITGVAVVILGKMWPVVLGYYVHHHWAIVPCLVFGSALTGLIMQYFTQDPNQHSTEEVIQAYHEHEGAIEMRAFPQKLLAAVTTVGFGGSAALEAAISAKHAGANRVVVLEKAPEIPTGNMEALVGRPEGSTEPVAPKTPQPLNAPTTAPAASPH